MKMSMSRAISYHAAQTPHQPALTCGEDTLNWEEFDRTTNRWARELLALGVGQDDFVTLALPNSLKFHQVAFACWKIGATPQPVSAKLPGRELSEIVELANSKLVVGANRDAVPGRAVIAIDHEPDPNLDDSELPDAVSTHWKAPTSGGSTGRPKLIVATSNSEIDIANPGFNVPAGSGCVIPGVMYHNGPFSISCLALAGGNHVVTFPRFDARQVLEAVTNTRPTYLYLVPTMMNRIWKLPDEVKANADMSSLKIAVHMAAPCPAWLKQAWIEWVGGDVLCELYSGTEVQAITWITGTEWLQHRGSVGRPIRGQIAIFDELGNPVPVGEMGDVYMRADNGKGSTYTYIGAEPSTLPGDETQEWETIGDLGWMDEDGYVYLADRRKDLILRGGANVYPAEVEAALEEFPTVRTCAVIGLDDDDLGQRVHALVDAPDGANEADLRAHMAQRLTSYKTPDSYEFVDRPVRNEAGKVRRSQLAADRTP